MSRPFGFSDALFDAANREARRRASAMSRIPNLACEPAIFGEDGASREQIEEIETYLGHTLAPDLVYLAEHTHDPDGQCMRWLKGPAEIEAFADTIKDGLCFDIENNGLWLTDWGRRPDNPFERLSILEAAFETWPKLLPLSGHRAIPATPADAGNPVFSLHQSDIIYYGATLADWVALDLTSEGRNNPKSRDTQAEPRHIPVWSDFADGTEGFKSPPPASERAQKLEDFRRRFLYNREG